MFRIKLAAVVIMPLTFISSIAVAQENQPDTPTRSTASSQPPNTQPQKQVSIPAAAPAQKAPPTQAMGADALPTTCLYVVPPGDVYGSYVPYSGPATPACLTPNAQAASINPSHPNSSTVSKQLDSLLKSASPSPLDLAPPTPNVLALSSAPAPSTEPSPAGEGGEGYIRSVPPPRPATIPRELRPFRDYGFGFRASTLGTGIEIATPIAGRINLRSSFNLFAFNDPFNIDGVDYGARLHLQSSQTTVDWFVNNSLHISPGFLYFKDTMSAPASVGPGQTFVLGGQTFLNSVDDPMTGTSSVVYQHKFAPLLLIGFGNLVPREGSRISFPIEFGAAYTGAPVINVNLNGTACTTEGCVSFAQNADAQTFLKKEIQKLNDDLKSFPYFPIVSVGVSYSF